MCSNGMEDLTEYFCSADKSILNLEFVYDYLHKRSYWAKGVPMETVRKSVEGSYCAGVYTRDGQVGFARMITDYATFGYLADVFIDENHRGKGLSKKLLSFIFNEPFVSGLRRIMLGTLDAHGLYHHYQFKALAHPDRFLELYRPDVYTRPF